MWGFSMAIFGRVCPKLFGAAIFALIFASSQPAHAADRPVHIFVDVSYAPDAGEFALKTTPLLLEWYPRVNAILYGPDHPLPFDNVVVTFAHGLDHPAFTTGNLIHISADVLRNRRDSYEGMVVHELTHVVQHYPQVQADAGWVVEGIADYVRHQAYEKDIVPTLRIDRQGHLTGYSDSEPYFDMLEKNGVDLRDKGYLRTYTVASTFLFWLETRKDRQIVRELNGMLAQGKYSPVLFAQFCGEPLDALWADFVKESQGAGR